MIYPNKKRAPVQGFSAGIPWSMHLRAYDAYCKKWGPQEALIDLEGRNCRGGFSVGELDEFIPGWREELSVVVEKDAEIARLLDHCDRLEAERDALREFARWVVQIGCFDACDLDGGSVQDMAVEYGVLVETSYDPEIHGENDVGANCGDPWFVFAWHAPSDLSAKGDGK